MSGGTKKHNSVLEKCALYASIGFSVIISLLDFFGLLDSIPWLKEQIPSITLLLVSLVLGFLAFELENKLNNLTDSQEKMWLFVQQENVKKIKGLRDQLDPNLNKIFGKHISDLIGEIENAVEGKRIEIKDLDLFRYFYKKTMEAYPKATFYATSLPYQRYFWKNQSMENAISHLVANGGKMNRVFFIRSDELPNDEVNEILLTQCQIGVKVYTTDAQCIPPHLMRFFVVEKEGRIAWEVFIGNGDRITNVIATSDPVAIDKYHRMYEEIMQLDGTRQFCSPK